MKVIKALSIILIAILVIFMMSLIVPFISHKNQLRKEAREHLPPCGMVEVNNKKMHVYTEGEGDITLVFMDGQGTNNPTLDFKPLWMRMADKFKIKVVERSGYG